MSYQISVLDKSPVAEGALPEQALRNSLQLAQRAEQLGYHRYWLPSTTPRRRWPAPHRKCWPPGCWRRPGASASAVVG